MNVLITSASRKVSLVKAFKLALEQEGGGDVIAVDADRRSAALYFADYHYITPLGLGDDYLKSVLAICLKHDVNLIIPTRDEELPFFSNNRHLFLATIMIPSTETIRICQDKHLFVDACKQFNISIPKTYINENDYAFPIFVRPRTGKGSNQTHRVDSKDELWYVLKEIEHPIIQEFIDAAEYTVDLFSDFSGKVLSVVPRRRLVVFGGESFVGKTVKNFPVIGASITLALALNLIGHNTIQCFDNDGDIQFIEVNPRYGGGASLGFAAGAPTPRYLVRLMLGRDVETEVGVFTDGLTMLRYTNDLFKETL